MEISNNGFSFFIEREPYETNKVFFSRCWWIKSKNPSNYNDFNETLKLSYLWSNIKYQKCEYNNLDLIKQKIWNTSSI